jgi:alpha-L-fucosidase
MGWPDRREILVPQFGLGGEYGTGKIQNVQLLGFKGKLSFSQDASALRVTLPQSKPCEHAVVLKAVTA